MYRPENEKDGFHTKGYVFRKAEMHRIIVGSSNVSQSALTTNRAWNTKIVSTDQGEYTRDIINEFEALWNSHRALPFDQFIDEYTEIYTRNKIIQKQHELAKAGAEITVNQIFTAIQQPVFFHAKRTPWCFPGFRAKCTQWRI